MPTLPSNVSYGIVKGRFLLAYGDGSDGDLFPDAEPAQGFIIFTPSVVGLKNTTASPDPVTIFPASVSCALDSEGYLVGSDNTRNVRLIATDDEENNPVGWTWRVNFRFTDSTGANISVPDPFSFSLPSGGTVDLTNALPVPDSNGTYYLVAPGMASGGTANQFLIKTSSADYATAWSSTIFGGSA